MIATALVALVAMEAPMSADEAAIHELHEDFAAAFAKGDAAALAAFYTADAVRVGVRGDVQHGAGEIKAAFLKLFAAGPFVGAGVRMEKHVIRMLAPDLALSQAPVEFHLKAGPVLRGYALDVLQKVDGKWRILESHPMVFPPPPPPPK